MFYDHGYCVIICPYRNLVDEFLLESAISRIQSVLMEECDNYFKDIAPDAIKVHNESR